jgi:hypothetical protein
MDTLIIGLVMHQRTDGYEALSALPDAPVVPYAEAVSAHRTRRSLERALRRLADVIAPPTPALPAGCNTC